MHCSWCPESMTSEDAEYPVCLDLTCAYCMSVQVKDNGDNFYHLLQEAKDLLSNNDWWVQ